MNINVNNMNNIAMLVTSCLQRFENVIDLPKKLVSFNNVGIDIYIDMMAPASWQVILSESCQTSGSQASKI